MLITAVFAMVTLSPEVFISVPAALLVFGCPQFLLLASASPEDIISAFARGIKGEADDGRAVIILGQARAHVWTFGAIGFFIGAVALMPNFGDSHLIGSALVLSLNSILYALLLGLLLRVLQLRVEVMTEVKRSADEEPGQQPPKDESD